MARKPKATPEILLPPGEQALRILARAIVSAHPDAEGRTAENRVAQAVAVLLGRSPPSGSSSKDRRELLEMLAFDYSLETKWKRRNDVTPTEIARRLVQHHPSTKGLAEKESIVRDLVRKFNNDTERLLNEHSYDSAEEANVFGAVGEMLGSLEDIGVAIDRSVLPPAFRQRR